MDKPQRRVGNRPKPRVTQILSDEQKEISLYHCNKKDRVFEQSRYYRKGLECPCKRHRELANIVDAIEDNESHDQIKVHGLWKIHKEDIGGYDFLKN